MITLIENPDFWLIASVVLVILEIFMAKKNYYAHETAIIDKGSKIGAETKIWHFSHIMPNCIIGKNGEALKLKTWQDSHSSIYREIVSRFGQSDYNDETKRKKQWRK